MKPNNRSGLWFQECF